MVEPLSLTSLIISSLFSVVYLLKKFFKKFKSSKCNTEITTNDGKKHTLSMDFQKSLKALKEIEDVIKSEIKTKNENNED